jgi:hypothetical protein
MPGLGMEVSGTPAGACLLPFLPTYTDEQWWSQDFITWYAVKKILTNSVKPHALNNKP